MIPAMRHLRIVLPLLALGIGSALAAGKPEWCRALPRPAYRSLERVPVKSDWFEVYRVAPGVFAIYEPHQWEETIAYLIVGSRRALLFDTGMGIANIKAVVDALTPLRVTVLNSHTHNDHVGDNWRFTDVRAMNTAFTRANAKGSRADAQEEIRADAICGQLPAGFDRQRYATKPFSIRGFIHDGAVFDLGGRKLEVLATPGHTPDSISLLDREHGLLFTGDMFYLGPIFLYRPETDMAAYRRSIARWESLRPGLKLLLPAHNTPSASPDYLARIVPALDAIAAGQVAGKPQDGGKVIQYDFGDFSFRLAAPRR